MGLAIHSYHRSYSTLQALRRWALSVENNPRKLDCKDYDVKQNCNECVYCALKEVGLNSSRWATLTRFPEFINHSDSSGGYISLVNLGIEKLDETKFREDLEWGNLDKLKTEIAELQEHVDTLPEDLQDAWEEFKNDVLTETSVMIFN